MWLSERAWQNVVVIGLLSSILYGVKLKHWHSLAKKYSLWGFAIMLNTILLGKQCISRWKIVCRTANNMAAYLMEAAGDVSGGLSVKKLQCLPEAPRTSILKSPNSEAFKDETSTRKTFLFHCCKVFPYRVWSVYLIYHACTQSLLISKLNYSLAFKITLDHFHYISLWSYYQTCRISLCIPDEA